MGSIGKFLTDDLLGVVQYPDVKHASAQYDQMFKKTQEQADAATNTANQGYGEAKGYRDEAGGIYRNLSSIGMNERDAALNMLNQILGEYGTTAGVATPLSFQPAKTAISPDNRTTPGPAPATNPTYTPGLSQGPPPASAPASNPYALTEPQQIQANTQIDEINREKQSVMEEIRARFAQQGITDPRAMQTEMDRIGERYDAIAAQQKAKFAEGARENREQSLAGLVDTFINLMQGGKATTAGSASGLQSVGGQAQNVGDTQSQLAASLLSSLTGGAQNKLMATQQAANQYDSDFSALLGYFLEPMIDNWLNPKKKDDPKKA
jgi:hypothetical protein